MAQTNQATVSWNANTEPDFAYYNMFAGVGAATGLSPTFLVSTGQTLTIPQLFTHAGPSYPDGLWFFTVTATDTSGNTSAQATPVSKRLIRQNSKLVVRR